MLTQKIITNWMRKSDRLAEGKKPATKNRQDEIKHVKDTLKLSTYPNTSLIK